MRNFGAEKAKKDRIKDKKDIKDFRESKEGIEYYANIKKGLRKKMKPEIEAKDLPY